MHAEAAVSSRIDARGIRVGDRHGGAGRTRGPRRGARRRERARPRRIGRREHRRDRTRARDAHGRRAAPHARTVARAADVDRAALRQSRRRRVRPPVPHPRAGAHGRPRRVRPAHGRVAARVDGHRARPVRGGPSVLGGQRPRRTHARDARPAASPATSSRRCRRGSSSTGPSTSTRSRRTARATSRRSSPCSPTRRTTRIANARLLVDDVAPAPPRGASISPPAGRATRVGAARRSRAASGARLGDRRHRARRAAAERLSPVAGARGCRHPHPQGRPPAGSVLHATDLLAAIDCFAARAPRRNGLSTSPMRAVSGCSEP